MDRTEQRLRNLLDVDVDLELPPATQLIALGQARHRRRIVSTGVVVAVLAIAAGTAVNAVRDQDPADVRLSNDPTTLPTTVTTTTPPFLEPAVSDTPASGICAPAETSPVVSITVTEDLADPRCVKVLSSQVLEIRNDLPGEARVSFGPAVAVLQPGESDVIGRPFGSYLQPGVHRLRIDHDLPGVDAYGPEVWLVPEP